MPLPSTINPSDALAAIEDLAGGLALTAAFLVQGRRAAAILAQPATIKAPKTAAISDDEMRQYGPLSVLFIVLFLSPTMGAPLLHALAVGAVANLDAFAPMVATWPLAAFLTALTAIGLGAVGLTLATLAFGRGLGLWLAEQRIIRRRAAVAR